MEASSSLPPAAQVYRPRADVTIYYSPSWGCDFVRSMEGELSKDYVVRDRPRRVSRPNMGQSRWNLIDFSQTFK